MPDCCNVITEPLTLSIVNIQLFIRSVHELYHELYSLQGIIKRHKKRLIKATDKEKVKEQLDAVVFDFTQKCKDLEVTYQSPYMDKVKVHYPDLYLKLLQLHSKFCQAGNL